MDFFKPSNLMNFKNRVSYRVGLWLAACLAVTLLFFRDFFMNLPSMLQPGNLQREGVYGWGILGVCFLWLFLKKGQVARDMKAAQTNLIYAVLGISIILGSMLLPSSSNFVTVYRMLAAFLGIFALLFGRAAFIPAFLLTVYAFTLVFPVLVRPLAEGPWGQATLWMVVGLSRLLGLPMASRGEVLTVFTSSGEEISALVTYECAGQVTMGVFLAIFALMMLDAPLSRKKAIVLLLIGILGTTFQNLVRIEGILWASHFWGWEG
ncbi:MAG: archaeosortase/exosortase family protein, partial [Dehalococcoidia bacterium]|nr:archaeosortase/exosortase family protein [Dehalococcoidia bacterium]